MATSQGREPAAPPLGAIDHERIREIARELRDLPDMQLRHPSRSELNELMTLRTEFKGSHDLEAFFAHPTVQQSIEVTRAGSGKITKLRLIGDAVKPPKPEVYDPVPHRADDHDEFDDRGPTHVMATTARGTINPHRRNPEEAELTVNQIIAIFGRAKDGTMPNRSVQALVNNTSITDVTPGQINMTVQRMLGDGFLERVYRNPNARHRAIGMKLTETGWRRYYQFTGRTDHPQAG